MVVMVIENPLLFLWYACLVPSSCFLLEHFLLSCLIIISGNRAHLIAKIGQVNYVCKFIYNMFSSFPFINENSLDN